MSPTGSCVEHVVLAGGSGLRGMEALGSETSSVEEVGHWGMGAEVDSTVPPCTPPTFWTTGYE